MTIMELTELAEQVEEALSGAETSRNEFAHSCRELVGALESEIGRRVIKEAARGVPRAFWGALTSTTGTPQETGL